MTAFLAAASTATGFLAARLPDESLWHDLALADLNTRVALLGAGVLGAAAGTVGTFMVLRRRALIADTLGHGTLPGVCIAFLLMLRLGESPRSLPVLLLGAAVSAAIAAGLVGAVQRLPRMRADTALAIVLGSLFGVGVAIMGVIQQLGTGHAAGLDALIDGNVASLRTEDAWTVSTLAAIAVAVTLVLFKELALLAFDPEQARLQGLPVRRLEFVQLVLVVLVTVAGLHMVGLILIIALLVIPASAARYWSDRLPVVTLAAALIGGVSGVLGAWISALRAGLPTGPLIVLVASLIFGVSLVVGRLRRRRQPAIASPEPTPEIAGGATP